MTGNPRGRISTWLLAASAVGGCAEAEPCGPTLWHRMRMLRLVTPFDPAALSEGRARYRPEVRLPAGEVKVHVRTERRYVGPVPTPEQLECLVQHGFADGFYPVLRDAARASITEKLRPIECELGIIAQELDAEQERLRRELAGTAEEIVLRETEPNVRARRQEIERRIRRSDKSRERYLSTSTPTESRWVRVTRDRFPRLFELEQGQAETELLREKYLEGELREFLRREGVSALDPSRCAFAEPTR